MIDDLDAVELADLAAEATTALADFLVSHEDDIALGINDYGSLMPVFYFTVGRLARPNVVH